jgi:hypothetical protein
MIVLTGLLLSSWFKVWILGGFHCRKIRAQRLHGLLSFIPFWRWVGWVVLNVRGVIDHFSCNCIAPSLPSEFFYSPIELIT